MDVKTLCLGALTTGEKTGYEIKRRFEEAFSHFFAAGYGSIYPALDELTRRGLVTCTVVEQDKRPDKKVYRLTEAGRRALVDDLRATPPRHKIRSEFLVLMYFAQLLPPERLGEVMDEMVAQWDRLLRDLEAAEERCLTSGDHTPGARFTIGYGRTVIAAARDYVRGQREALPRAVHEAAASVRAPEPIAAAGD
ncbi:MAG TPA: PadR family transcriptional regulator [Geminicoccaceae bacterium]|nr:PadR family transcriptional regulator [Geminicoccaceae bacterium]